MQRWLFVLIAVLSFASTTCAADAVVTIDSPMPPPNWALLERQLLRAQTDACAEFFEKYFDERGYLLCVERWGGDDGPDDAIENCNGWPILHAMGAADNVLRMYKKAWEGHLRQYTAAKTTEVPFARDGMYYKEFPVMFDWQHNGEGISVFNLQGLSDPDDISFGQRVRRYAGFYMDEDPGAPNYDPQHKVIRSMINGSRGPLMRKATGLDWAGDPIEVENRFGLGHGERNYEEMVAHFKDYNDVVGDHPLNLISTTLALNAYMLTGDEKYRTWLLDYVDAWLQRMDQNGGVIPSNIGLDGTIGGAADGKWYGGTYGWGFTVVVPQTGKLADRNRQYWGFIGFMNAYLLTGDDRYLQAWRKQADVINAQKKIINGQAMYPRMYGDEGWYSYVPQPYEYNAREIYFLSMNPEDLRRAPQTGWFDFLDGKDPNYPENALRADFENLRRKIEGMREDTTTPDTRLADDPMQFNPARVRTLLQLTQGGWLVERRGAALFARLRYFDPIERRAGLPEDVAALVTKMTDDLTVVTLVNINQQDSRTVTVQAGGYGEHQFSSAEIADETTTVDAPTFTVKLAPGAGETLTLHMQRHVNRPTMSFPWNR